MMGIGNGNGITKSFSGLTNTIVGALLIAAIGGLITLWRDVSLIQRRQETTLAENAAQHAINQEFRVEQERMRTVIGVMERFKGSYDRQEELTLRMLTDHLRLITDLQQQLKVLQEHVTTLERTQGIPVPKSP